jgi:hypothetical protein
MSLGQGQALAGPGDLFLSKWSARFVEEFGEDFREVLAFCPRPSSIVEPRAQRLRLACGDIAPSPFCNGGVEAHSHLGNGHTFTLPPLASCSADFCGVLVTGVSLPQPAEQYALF